MSQCAAIIAAAGSGERFGATLPKALITLGNRTLIEHAVAALAPVASEIVICAPAGYEKQTSRCQKAQQYLLGHCQIALHRQQRQ